MPVVYVSNVGGVVGTQEVESATGSCGTRSKFGTLSLRSSRWTGTIETIDSLEFEIPNWRNKLLIQPPPTIRHKLVPFLQPPSFRICDAILVLLYKSGRIPTNLTWAHSTKECANSFLKMIGWLVGLVCGAHQCVWQLRGKIQVDFKWLSIQRLTLVGNRTKRLFSLGLAAKRMLNWICMPIYLSDELWTGVGASWTWMTTEGG